MSRYAKHGTLSALSAKSRNFSVLRQLQMILIREVPLLPSTIASLRRRQGAGGWRVQQKGGATEWFRSAGIVT